MNSNYEIMVLADPNSDLEFVDTFFKSVFKKNKFEIEKLERTVLAYQINKSTKGNYFLIKLETNPANISEFRRRVKLEPKIWRSLDINIDSEKGLHREIKERPQKQSFKPRGLANPRFVGKTHKLNDNFVNPDLKALPHPKLTRELPQIKSENEKLQLNEKRDSSQKSKSRFNNRGTINLEKSRQIRTNTSLKRKANDQ